MFTYLISAFWEDIPFTVISIISVKNKLLNPNVAPLIEMCPFFKKIWLLLRFLFILVQQLVYVAMPRYDFSFHLYCMEFNHLYYI